MTRFAIMTSVLVADDAVGNDVLGMHACLTAAGHEVRLFADSWGVKSPAVEPLASAPRFLRDPQAVAVYHHCAGWAAGFRALRRARCRKVVRYHNITPASFFEGISPIHAKVCARGRAELGTLTRCGINLYLPCSEYNRIDLAEVGIPDKQMPVVPPFHHVDQLIQAPSERQVVATCRDGRANVLFVGRVAPNKGHILLLDAFEVYRRHYRPEARLLIVGREEDRLQLYTARIREHAERRQLTSSVVFTGEVPVGLLKAYFQSADVFLSASEHEGFCVPVVEAMALRVPVVAYGSSALPETIGDAGIVWPEPDPYALAAATARVVADPGLADALRARGARRYQERFRTDRIAAAFLGALGVASPKAGRKAA